MRRFAWRARAVPGPLRLSSRPPTRLPLHLPSTAGARFAEPTGPAGVVAWCNDAPALIRLPGRPIAKHGRSRGPDRRRHGGPARGLHSRSNVRVPRNRPPDRSGARASGRHPGLAVQPRLGLWPVRYCRAPARHSARRAVYAGRMTRMGACGAPAEHAPSGLKEGRPFWRRAVPMKKDKRDFLACCRNVLLCRPHL